MYISQRSQPTDAEFEEAVFKLTTSMEKSTVLRGAAAAEDIKWGLIGDIAVFFYAKALGLPHRRPTDIKMVIQPNYEISVEEISNKLCTEKAFEGSSFSRDRRSKILQMIIMRGKKEICIDIQIVDHYVWPQYRNYYNLDLIENKISSFKIGEQDVLVLNAPWILQQQIREWNECDVYEKKAEIITNIKTMCDVLSLEKKKLFMRSKRDIDELKNLRDHFEDDIAILSAVIDCPEVLGPWYNLRWVQNLLLSITILAAFLACDYYASGEMDDTTPAQHSFEI